MQPKLHGPNREKGKKCCSVAPDRRENTKKCRMQVQFLHGKKVDNIRKKCIKMWKTSENSLKNGWYYVENPVDAVDSTQFGHKFMSNLFLYISCKFIQVKQRIQTGFSSRKTQDKLPG